MSIFIGTSNSGNKILHMTNALVNSTDIKSDVALPSTIFHSSLPYLQLLTSYNVTVTRSVTYTSGGYADYSFTALFPNTAIDLVLAGYKYVIVLSSTNSSGRTVIVDSASRFNVRVGVSPSINFGTTSAYSWGPTANAGTWEDNPYSVPSYTNNHILLSDKLNYDTRFLYPHNYGTLGNALDSVNGNIATVYFFNIKGNLLETISSTNSIFIDYNTFLIGTPSGNIDLATFKPMRYVTSPTPTSFSTLGSTINIQPYVPPASPLLSWIINGNISNAGSITKKLTDGSTENIISNTSQNLVLVGSITTTYSISKNNGAATLSLGISVGSDEAISVVASGTFSSAITTKTTGGHANFLTNNGILETVSYGRTESIVKGVTYGDLYKLQFGVVGGDLKVGIVNQKLYTTSSYTGTFTGTVYILKYKIK